MKASQVARATAAATSTVSSLDLTVEDALVLHNSNRLTLRLLPCDVVARVAPVALQTAEFEVELAQRLTAAGCPVAALEPRVDPRVHQRDGFEVSLWTYYEPETSADVAPADYARALERLHAGMRTLDIAVPHVTDRVHSAHALVTDRASTPGLSDADRVLLADALRRFTPMVSDRGRDQLLHGEPHPGNLLSTADGLLFVDLETCCRGPVEFDLAHAPDEVSEHYPDVNPGLLRACRTLMLAMITAWRWDAGDALPDGRRLGFEGLGRLRASLRGHGLQGNRSYRG